MAYCEEPKENLGDKPSAGAFAANAFKVKISILPESIQLTPLLFFWAIH
jgi:hypothetical protein